MRDEWYKSLTSVTQDIIRDVSQAIDDQPSQGDFKLHCLVLLMAGIAWNTVPLHLWRCGVYEVLSDAKNDFTHYSCACGHQFIK